MSMESERKLTKTTLVSAIVSQLMARLKSGELQPGDRLPSIKDLAVIFGVSRNSMREALSVLCAMGYVSAQVGGGSYISQPPMQGLSDPFAILLAQNAFSESEFLRIARLLEIAAMAAISSEDASELSMLSDPHFFRALMERAGNRAAASVHQICESLAKVDDPVLLAEIRRALPDSDKAAAVMKTSLRP